MNQYKIITFCDKNFIDLAKHWIKNIEKAGIKNYIIFCADLTTIDELKKSAPLKNLRFYKKEKKDNFWIYRTNKIKKLLVKGRNIIHSDLDAIWFKDIRKYMNSDCDIHISRAYYAPQFHKEKHGFVMCCGLYAFKSNPRTINFMEYWCQDMNTTNDDQISFNKLLLETTWSDHLGENRKFDLKIETFTDEMVQREYLSKNGYIYHLYVGNGKVPVQERIDALKRMNILEKNYIFVHVGKTGGSTIRHTLDTLLGNRFSFMHVKQENKFNPYGNYIIWVRDPLKRFVSAFNYYYALINDQKTVGKGRTVFEGNLEPYRIANGFPLRLIYLINQFGTANNVGEALSTDHPNYSKAKALLGFEHFSKSFSYYLQPNLIKHPENIVFVGRTEYMEEDHARLVEMLDGDKNMPIFHLRKNISKAVSNYLSPIAIKNIKGYYDDDYFCLRKLIKYGFLPNDYLDDYTHTIPPDLVNGETNINEKLESDHNPDPESDHNPDPESDHNPDPESDHNPDPESDPNPDPNPDPGSP